MSIRSTKAQFKDMRQFKAVAMDYAYFATLSDQGLLYCLSEQQIYVLLVQLEYVGWLTRWYNTDDITQTTVDRIKSDIMEALMSCVDVSILVDQANENLITQVTNRAIQSEQLRDALAAEYIPGDPTSINPNAPTVDFGNTGDRFDALCAGLMAFVYQFARAQADSIRAGQIGGLAAISLIAVLLIPGLNIFFLVGASIAVLIGLGTVGVTTEVAILALTDTDALDNVVCCMRDNLRDQGVNEANWLNALDGCSFGVGSNEQIVADFLGATLADNYLTILNILGQAYTGVINGDQLPECPCAPFAGVWQILPVPGYNSGVITDQTENSLEATAELSFDGYYRVTMERATGCSKITAFTCSVGTPDLLQVFYCAGGSTTSIPVAVNQEVNGIYYADTSPYTIVMTWDEV